MSFQSCVEALLIAKDEGAGGWAQFGMLPLLAAFGLLFYFIVLGPERRKQKDHKALIENIKKNDRVVTVGGIKGVVTNVNRDTKELTVRIDETTNTRIHVEISAIARVETDGNGEEKSTSKSS